MFYKPSLAISEDETPEVPTWSFLKGTQDEHLNILTVQTVNDTVSSEKVTLIYLFFARCIQFGQSYSIWASNYFPRHFWFGWRASCQNPKE